MSKETAMGPSAWEAPILLGNRLCWFDGLRNVTIPVVQVRPIYRTPPDDFDRGWHAVLPTENGAQVSLTWDPENHFPDEPPCSIWLDVPHPEYEHLIPARVEGDRIVYDPECLGDQCPGCEHDWDRWWHYVDSPHNVLARLAEVGSLPIVVPSKNGSGEKT